MRWVGVVTSPEAIDALLATACTGDGVLSPDPRARAPPDPLFGQLPLPWTG